MKIDSLRTDEFGRFSRILADVSWEDSDRKPMTVWIGVPGEFSPYLSCSPEAFLTACLLPAMRHGETRVKLSEPMCPRLCENLEHVMRQMEVWYGNDWRAPRIECPVTESSAPLPRGESACFLSGGVDSLALLRDNTTRFAPEHPGRFRACILVGGMDFFRGKRDVVEAAFDEARVAAERVVSTCGAQLIPVWTNIRDLEPDGQFYLFQSHGAIMASIAHALSTRYCNFSIASSFHLSNMHPWGTTPWLDPYFGSHRVRINHEQAWLTRLDKVRILADWPSALKAIRVCTETFHGQYNCGKCEKCLRTMVALEALGLLDQAESFATRHIDTARLRKVRVEDEYRATCYRELLPLLAARGRHDLIRAINTLLRRYRWRAPLRALDQRYFGGVMKRLAVRRRGNAGPAAAVPQIRVETV